MTTYRALTRYLLAPMLDTLRGTHTMRCLSELEESQWWPLERIQQLQSQRLQRLVRYAHERVPYYRRLMDERGVSPDSIRTAADLQRLPILTKQDIREHHNELQAQGFPRGELCSGRTSGSTGTPLVFSYSRQGRRSHGIARSLRALEFAGAYPGDPILSAVNPEPHGFRQAVAAAITRFVARHAYEDPGSFSNSSLPLVVDRIAKFRPRALGGFVSAICILAEFIRDSGFPCPEVGAVITGGEQLFDAQRALLRDVFGSEPFSKYSSFENYDIAMECEVHAGLHVAAEDLVVEVVDDSGRPVRPGHVGHVVITNLHEYGLPLIRYNTDDESSFIEGACPCGRSLPRLSDLIGRTGSAIYTPSGKRFSPLSLSCSHLAPMGVRQFQLVQEQPDHVTVKVVPDTDLSSSDAHALAAAVTSHFGSRLGDDVRIDTTVVDRIEPTAAGKHLYLISKVKRPVG
jgi:phenylacetate-CoA ligase